MLKIFKEFTYSLLHRRCVQPNASYSYCLTQSSQIDSYISGLPQTTSCPFVQETTDVNHMQRTTPVCVICVC